MILISDREQSRHICAGQSTCRGSVSLGFGPDGRKLRRKVSGRTRTQVKEKLKDLHEELREGFCTSATYTVQNAVDDWLACGLDGRSANTISTNREVLAQLTALIGAREAEGADSGRRRVGTNVAALVPRPGVGLPGGAVAVHVVVAVHVGGRRLLL